MYDSAVAIPDKLGMTEALKASDSSDFGGRAHLFWGLAEPGRNLSNQNMMEECVHHCSRAEPAWSLSAATFIVCF